MRLWLQFSRVGGFLEDQARFDYGSDMTHKSNPRQLVLRRDTATGLTLVGWASDLPVGRFQHLQLISESDNNFLPDIESAEYGIYQSALEQARQANSRMLQQQVRSNQTKGWYLVPFELAGDRQAMQSDSIGNYAAAAMQLHYQLTCHCKQAWTIIRDGAIVHVRARYPRKMLDELTYQVWYHKQRFELNKIQGALLEGELMICESGLWFAAYQPENRISDSEHIE